MTATHTHHQFGEEIPCDLPDTYEAHYGPKTFTIDEDGYRVADHPIFTCANCGYQTTDGYTAGVINDISNDCPECGSPANTIDEGGSGIWCNDDCGWYQA